LGPDCPVIAAPLKSSLPINIPPRQGKIFLWNPHHHSSFLYTLSMDRAYSQPNKLLYAWYAVSGHKCGKSYKEVLLRAYYMYKLCVLYVYNMVYNMSLICIYYESIWHLYFIKILSLYPLCSVSQPISYRDLKLKPPISPWPLVVFFLCILLPLWISSDPRGFPGVNI
jgi:hypothetical protein